MDKFEKYIKVTNWLWRRYSNDGILVVFTKGKDSRYTRLEKLFFEKYLVN